MRSADDRLFAVVCYLALMDHHGAGWQNNAHPNYIMEKLSMLDADSGYAMAQLDEENQYWVLKYYKFWKLQLPPVVKTWVDRNEGHQQRSLP